MSDDQKTREAIERVALRIKDHSQKRGRVISFEDAKGKARQIAVDYKRKFNNNGD